MNSQTIFIIILGILSFEYILEQILTYLNSKKMSSAIPEEIQDIYDAEKYKKQQEYQKTNVRFGILVSTFNTIILFVFILLDGFAFVDDYIRAFTENQIYQALLFFGSLLFVSDVLNIPFSLYNIFVIEESFGFNKTTVKTYILDKLKGLLVSSIIGGAIISLIVWSYMLTGELFWIYALGLISGFSIFMVLFYSNLIVPLFNKQTPLEDGELKSAIKVFADKVGFKVDNIFVINGSKRSTKANAYFTGFGAKKRIVLYDTLINELSIEEIVAVLAHEIGHYKHGHTVKGMILSLSQTALMLYVLSLFIYNPLMSTALGATTSSFHMSLITFGILYSPLSTIISLLSNVFSRKNEYQADKFTKDNYEAKHLVSSLKKLSINSLSNLTPHKAFVFFHYSHPTLLQRIKAIS